MNNRPSIAGVILTLNEEHDLRRSLSSLLWCDEIVVVDSGSTDNTFQIATELGARFLTHIQQPPFLITEQRNWVLDHSSITSDWVLFLDADEEVGESLRSSILSFIMNNHSFTSCELTPRYWFLGKWLKCTQGYPNWHPRLVRRGFTHFQGGVWEIFSEGSLTTRINEPYEHYAFSKGLDDWIERHKRYSTWDAKQIYELNSRLSVPSSLYQRHQHLQTLVARLWPIKPLLRFLQKYLLQFGFTEGWRSLLFCLLMFTYDLFTVVKVVELIRKENGKQL